MKSLFSGRVRVVALCLVAAVVMAVLLLPRSVDATGNDSPTATVIPWGLNLREGPGMTYKVLGQLSRGEVVHLTGYRDAAINWVQVKTAAGKTGWVGARHLKSDYPFKNLTVSGTTPPAEGPRMVATVDTHALNVRKGPGSTYGIVGYVSQDDEVKLSGYRNADTSWVQIQTPKGVTGWVNAYYLKTDYPLKNLAVADGGGDNLAGATPEQVVESFYSWYVEYARDTGNPLASRAYRTQAHLTADFIRRVDRIVDQGTQVDPFLLAQDVPSRFEVGKATITGNTARLILRETFSAPSTKDIMVLLRRVDGHWKIDDVQPRR